MRLSDGWCYSVSGIHSRFAIYSSPLGGYGVLALGSRAALLKFALGKALPNFWQVGPKPRDCGWQLAWWGSWQPYIYRRGHDSE